MIEGVRNVLVGVTAEGEHEPRAALAYALSLAQAAGAHLTVQAAALKLALAHGALARFAAGLAGSRDGILRALAEAAAERTRQEAAAAGVACTVASPRLEASALLDAFVREARVHDLCVLDAEPDALDLDRGLIEAVLVEGGRPVLVVPPDRTRFSARRILVAWDGGIRASRAFQGALPFLRAAESVELVSVLGGSGRDRAVPGADAAAHLARHGVPVEVATVANPGGDVAAVLRDRADGFGADLMVLGAYEHPRLREWLLGGVTQSFLKRSAVPILLAH